MDPTSSGSAHPSTLARPSRAATCAGDRTAFGERGFVGPFRVFSGARCRAIVRALRHEPRRVPPDWDKGHAITSRLLFEIASNEVILERVSAVLGPDVVLWGASVVRKAPGDHHAWHTDRETAASEGNAATVWVALRHASPRSSLIVVPGSHRVGRPVQSVVGDRDQTDEITLEELEDVATRVGADRPIMLEMRHGQAVMFDGRLWHGSLNRNRWCTRSALLLQYATADLAIRMPEPGAPSSSFACQAEPRPPCVVVRGSAMTTPNRLMAGPEAGTEPELRRLSTCVTPLRLPLAGDPEHGWRSHPIMRGTSSQLAEISCHATVLSPGRSPHAPHPHPEEEVLIAVDGEAALEVRSDDGVRETKRLVPGQFAYHPTFVRHSIRNPGAAPITYLVLRWRGAAMPGTADAHVVYDAAGEPLPPAGGIHSTEICDRPTRYLRALQCHVTTLGRGEGYAPHADAYDVAVLTRAGTVRTLGRTVGPGTFLYYAAGEPHDMWNVGPDEASYLVFELHGRADTRFARPSIRDRLWAWRRAAIRGARRRPVLRAAGQRALRRFPWLTRLLG